MQDTIVVIPPYPYCIEEFNEDVPLEDCSSWYARPQFLCTCYLRPMGGRPPKNASSMVGRVPLIPLILAGNSTPTIPHQYSQHKRAGFPVGSCDTAAAGGRCGSNVYEVNQWLWQFGRSKPRLGGLSVERTGDRKEAAQKERLLHGAETRRRRKADLAWWETKCGCEQSTCQYVKRLYTVHTCMYLYIPC